MADFEASHLSGVTASELRRAVLDGDEIAVVDVREAERYASGHISVAVELAASEIEFRATRLLPRRGVRVVVVDDDGLGLAPEAVARLQALGYSDVRVLTGGVRGWAAAGNELLTGLHSLSRALAEFADRNVAPGARVGVETIDSARLDGFEAERDLRTLYVFDVRTDQAFEAGHRAGAVLVPAEQLVLATDRFIGVRGARVVLLDEADLARASITASWLIRLGLDDVFVASLGAGERTETGPVAYPLLGDLESGEVVRLGDLASLLAGGATLLDLETAPADRLYIPGSIRVCHSTLTSHLELVPGAGPIVLTSGDGVLARLAAAELLWRSRRRVLALAGGTSGWVAAGLGKPGHGSGQAVLDASKVQIEPDDIVTQLQRDGLVHLREA